MVWGVLRFFGNGDSSHWGPVPAYNPEGQGHELKVGLADLFEIGQVFDDENFIAQEYKVGVVG